MSSAALVHTNGIGCRYSILGPFVAVNFSFGDAGVSQSGGVLQFVNSANQCSARFIPELLVGVNCKVESRVAYEPFLDPGDLVGGVVVQHEVQVQVLRHGDVDGLEELQELVVVAVTPLGVGGHRAVADVERGEQARSTVTNIVVGHPRLRARRDRQNRRSSNLPAANTRAFSGEAIYKPTTSRILSMNCGSAESFQVSTVCGLSARTSVRSADRDCDIAVAEAVDGLDLCVSCAGVSSSVVVITSSTRSSVVSRGQPRPRLIR